jgi:hypothetical protein
VQEESLPRWAMTCGSRGSAAEEGKRIPFRVLIRDGPRLNLGLGRNGFPGPFLIFYFYFFFFSFFRFLFLFLSFGKMLQINSN